MCCGCGTDERTQTLDLRSSNFTARDWVTNGGYASPELEVVDVLRRQTAGDRTTTRGHWLEEIVLREPDICQWARVHAHVPVMHHAFKWLHSNSGSSCVGTVGYTI
jgi:hypothetical protein